MNRKILVVGAGIAGHTFASWLARSGAQATVVARCSGLRVGGQGVDVRHHALEIVDRTGTLPPRTRR